MYTSGDILNGFELINYLGRSNWECRCTLCSKLYRRNQINLQKRSHPYCGCDLAGIIDISGRVSGKLTVISRDAYRKVGKSYKYFWWCECTCGKVISVPAGNITAGTSNSCGCGRIKHSTLKQLEEYTANYKHRERVRGYKEWRASVLNSADHICEVSSCGSANNLHAHHTYPWSIVRYNSERRFKGGATLCKVCHMDFHKLCPNNSASAERLLAYFIFRNTEDNTTTKLNKQERIDKMNVLEKEVVEFFERMLQLEEDKKAIADEIKSAVETFAENADLEPEALSEGIRKYKKYLKDPAKFVLTDYSIDQIINSFVSEYQKSTTEFATGS